ncbi:alpha/beta-hydrolase [Dothidotthia symphoricarpi CBS 119687]|uniref:Alpha/beta-hydrolase n=1 Tax=Dothidotthia symphoricarpi CBS 119687 TaxID=1392245 RepID=A0A6A6AM23_9PLEO|nr:alpha/beta-hydrolase [Dothidotthia symphoricarpi CBS 119687]KAF2132616.1 alpha/beta-hydrolase [Dothidotthia symphoricarpi CBS 119687]
MATTITTLENLTHGGSEEETPKTQAAIEFAQQAERLGQYSPHQEDDSTGSTQAVEALFITAQDPVIQTANGHRLPAVPIDEARKLNKLRAIIDDRDLSQEKPLEACSRESKDGTIHGVRFEEKNGEEEEKQDAPLGDSKPSSRTNPLFPPLPIAAERAWERRHAEGTEKTVDSEEEGKDADEFVPLEGGPDEIQCDVRYYARRVGLDCEAFEVQTEDGFIIELWHIYNPRDYKRSADSQRTPHSPDIFSDNNSKPGVAGSQYAPGDKKYPVLMIHGLLQSSGAYCTQDDDSLAFFLAKSGYDVWLGNNRCGFNPKHVMLEYNDPRMWAWNIRQMGVMDLPALISRVLSETGFEKLGLIAHSQGTTQSFVALAKEQRPDIGDKISVFCALAPAAYAGPLIEKAYLKFMSLISPGMFRAVFGIHAFIPFMMSMHALLPAKFYGAMGYQVFSFLFNWTDDRWERALRDRMFQFAPVYVSAESMRWWLGRECFARQKCILSTREETSIEEREDEEEDQRSRSPDEQSDDDERLSPAALDRKTKDGGGDEDRARFAWYGPHTPPFALWVCGADDLVDGRRLLRRFERNREPFVDVVHSKVIDGYEHLDVIWAMDAIEQVGKEVREVLWKTAPEEAREVCRTPRGCEDVAEFYQRRSAEGEVGRD